jgi:hypothetical protein
MFAAGAVLAQAYAGGQNLLVEAPMTDLDERGRQK